MPELAEVETVRRALDKSMRGKKMVRLEAVPGEKILFAGHTFQEIEKALRGARVIGTGRKGKYFWFELNRRPWPLLHLGMSGKIAICLPHNRLPTEKMWEGVQFLRAKEMSRVEHLKFCRLLIHLDDQTEVAFIDPRRFGRIRLVEDPLKDTRIQKMGIDPLADFPSVDQLAVILKRRRIAIKALLLDQKVFTGVGNWLADEILFQSGLSPHHLASTLNLAQIKKLRAKMMLVITKAVDARASYELFPKTWLFHHRWGKKQDAQTSRGQKIIHEEIGGRTTAWVPSVQK